MTLDHGTSRHEPGDPPRAAGAPTYQGSRFPWWLTILYGAFVIFGFLYMARYYLPDLKSWLAR